MGVKEEVTLAMQLKNGGGVRLKVQVMRVPTLSADRSDMWCEGWESRRIPWALFSRQKNSHSSVKIGNPRMFEAIGNRFYPS